MCKLNMISQWYVLSLKIQHSKVYEVLIRIFFYFKNYRQRVALTMKMGLCIRKDMVATWIVVITPVKKAGSGENMKNIGIQNVVSNFFISFQYFPEVKFFVCYHNLNFKNMRYI